MSKNSDSSDTNGASAANRARIAPSLTIGILVSLVPLVVLLGGYFVLMAAGVRSAKALSLSGLVTVGAAAIWGFAVAAFRIDARLLGAKALGE